MRACINNLTEHVNTLELTQTMGHADGGDTYATYYRSKLPSVDVQGILMGGKQEKIDWNQYMRPERVESMPGALPLSKLREVEVQVSTEKTVQARYRLRQRLRDEASKEAKESATTRESLDRMPSKLLDSVALLGDLRLQTTIERITTTRFCEDASIVLDSFDTPDFDLRTNGLAALKALSRILRAHENKTKITYYYPDEYPISVNEGRDLACGECGVSLKRLVVFIHNICTSVNFIPAWYVGRDQSIFINAKDIALPQNTVLQVIAIDAIFG
jgi:hypothetical protein